MLCPFCDIAAGRSRAHIVLESPSHVAFLDHRPLFPGHVLLIPREHIETLPDLPEDQVAQIFQSAKSLCRAVQEATGAQGSFLAVNNRVSQSVPHLHIHIVPRTKGDGLKGFFWPRKKYESDAEMAEVARRIRDAAERSRSR
jgi:histidine triad (HIT) family protein